MIVTQHRITDVDYGDGIRIAVKYTLVRPLKLNLLSFPRLDGNCITIAFEREKCMISYRETDNRVLRTLKKRDSDGPFAANGTGGT